MTEFHFWFLFVCIALLALYCLFLWRILVWPLISYENDEFSCDDEVSDMIRGKAPIHPDERGVVGELKDSHDNRYYLVVMPKDDFDDAYNELVEDQRHDRKD